MFPVPKTWFLIL